MTRLPGNVGRAAPTRIKTIVQGENGVSADPDVIFSTILGSCVSVALFDPGARLGGLNHYLLPEAHGDGRGGVKYGAMAIELLINNLLKAGAVRSRLVAKLFGGSNIMSGLGDIGSRNAKFAREFMHREGFPVSAEDLGGTQARRLQFHPATGKARVFTIPKNEAASLALSERRVKTPPRQEVTLF